MNRFISQIKNVFMSPQLEEEVLYAFMHKLPENIDVYWKRDGDYIIGVIKEDGKEYATQAKSGDEFVNMVNDAVYTVHGVPEEYRETMLSLQAYTPPEEARKKLDDLSINKAEILVRKKVRAA